jgi:hypothetical protein
LAKALAVSAARPVWLAAATPAALPVKLTRLKYGAAASRFWPLGPVVDIEEPHPVIATPASTAALLTEEFERLTLASFFLAGTPASGQEAVRGGERRDEREGLGGGGCVGKPPPCCVTNVSLSGAPHLPAGLKPDRYVAGQFSPT